MKRSHADEILPEYDFSRGARWRESSKSIVTANPNPAAVFDSVASAFPFSFLRIQPRL